MTMQLTPARPSLAMYGKSLAETTAIKDWMMRRIGQTSIPEGSLVRRHAPTISGLGAAGERGPFPGQGPGPKRWPVTQFGDTVGVKDWDMRRIWKKRIPASSLLGIGSLAAHVGTRAERQWGVNPLSETTYVRDTHMRRSGKERYDADGSWHEQANVAGFAGGVGVLDATITVHDLQVALRKMGICRDAAGASMAIDGTWGPITQGALMVAIQQIAPNVPTPGLFSAAPRATTVMLETSFWQRIQTLATGRVDSCGGSSPARTGTTDTTGGGGTTDPGPSPDAGGDAMAPDAGTPWYQNPMYWLGVAAVAGIGYYVYTSGGEGESWDGGSLLPMDASY